jgi:hypothetical protein
MSSYQRNGQSEFQRDNLAGVSFDRPWKYALIPGAIIQWWFYMNPSRGFHGLAVSWRAARSPIMTYVFSAAFWGVVILVGVGFLERHYGFLR